jgi:peptide/nickel transport system substrate-binding protein
MTSSLISRRSFLVGSSLLAITLSTAAKAASNATSSATKAATGEPVSGGTLVVGQYQEPTFYDPNRQYSWETYRLDKHIYESLLAEDLSVTSQDGPPPLVPALAESYEANDDFTRFKFKLRRGVKFHDGEDFNADALHFNIRRFTDKDFEFYDVRAGATMKNVYGTLTAFNIIDDHTVEYVFSEPFREFPRMLPQGNYVSGVFSPKALRTYGQDGLAEHPTGTGPLKFVERIRNEKTVLQRNDDYWGTKARVERIIFRPITDDSTRLSALQSGEIDILTRTPTDAVETLTDAGYQVLDSTGAGQLFLGWHFTNKYAASAKVRQAIIQAIDREGIAKTLFRGHALPSYSILNIGNTAYDPAQRDHAYDPEAARKLLAEEGFKDGEIAFTIITDEANQPTIEWIQRDLAKIGIKVSIVSQEWLTYTANLGKLPDDVALFAMEWGFITPYWLKLVYQGYILGHGGKDAVGEEAAKLIAAATREPDEAKAIALWKQANGVLQDKSAILPLLTFTRYFTAAANVRGFNAPAQNFYDLSTVWLEA